MTTATLAKRMAFDGYAAERFRTRIHPRQRFGRQFRMRPVGSVDELTSRGGRDGNGFVERAKRLLMASASSARPA
jgi:hypothetical protein